MLDVLTLPKLIIFIRDFKRLQQKHITQVLYLGDMLSAAVKDRLIDISNELYDENLSKSNTVTTFNISNDKCYDLLVLGVQPRTAMRFKLLWSNNLPFPHMHPQYTISITNYSTLYTALCKFRVVVIELWGLLTANESTHIPVLFREGAEPGLFDILMTKIPQDHGVNVLKLIPHKQLKNMTMDDFLLCVFAKFKVYKDQSDQNQDHMDNLRLSNSFRNDHSSKGNDAYRTPTSTNPSPRTNTYSPSSTNTNRYNGNNNDSMRDNKSVHNIHTTVPHSNYDNDRHCNYDDVTSYDHNLNDYENNNNSTSLSHTNNRHNSPSTHDDVIDVYEGDEYDVYPQQSFDSDHNPVESLNNMNDKPAVTYPCFEQIERGQCTRKGCTFSHNERDLYAAHAARFELYKNSKYRTHAPGSGPPSGNRFQNNPIHSSNDRGVPKSILPRPSNPNLNQHSGVPLPSDLSQE
jgi:hypothetical protein